MMVLTEPKNSMIKQYNKLFRNGRREPDGDARRPARPRLAGGQERAPARAALRSLLERLMLDVMYDLPSREDIADVTINRAVVEGRRSPLIRKKQDQDAA